MSYKILVTPAAAAVLNLVVITILNYIYSYLAAYLTNLEFLRSQTEYDESLTLKIYLFQFVNYYSSIFYIAFVKGKFVGYPAKYNRIFNFRQEECSPGGCLMELCVQLAIIMIGLLSVWFRQHRHIPNETFFLQANRQSTQSWRCWYHFCGKNSTHLYIKLGYLRLVPVTMVQQIMPKE
jgi:hypothetical protein